MRGLFMRVLVKYKSPRDQMWTPTSICLHLFKQSWERTQWIWVLWITTSSNRPHFAIISPFYENSQTQLSRSSVSSWILCNFKTELNGLWSHNPLNRLPICKRISAKVRHECHSNENRQTLTAEHTHYATHWPPVWLYNHITGLLL